jgi:hypothetical protein
MNAESVLNTARDAFSQSTWRRRLFLDNLRVLRRDVEVAARKRPRRLSLDDGDMRFFLEFKEIKIVRDARFRLRRLVLRQLDALVIDHDGKEGRR